MIEGKGCCCAKYIEEVCLLEQPFFREPEKKVGVVVSDSICKDGREGWWCAQVCTVPARKQVVGIQY